MTAKARFLYQNQAASDAATIVASSAVSGFGASLAVNEQRWKKWRPQGAFRITSANKKIYINDGSDKTITLTEATYTSAASLASHAQTQLNASSSNWTVSYSSTTGKFTFGRSSGTALFRLATTTDAAWSTFGYTGSVNDDVGTGQAADVRRNHTSETWTVDMGAAVACSAFIAIGAAASEFLPSSSATLTLKASNSNSATTPWGASYDAVFTLTRTADGIAKFFDEVTYRYWQYEITDLTNTAGPNLDHCQIYLGPVLEPELRNLSVGFERELTDPSVAVESEAGNLFWRLKTKYWRYSGLSMEWLSSTDRTSLETMIKELGTSTPFFLALDPDAAASDSTTEFTKYVVFDGPPRLTHRRYIYHDLSFSLREVV